MRATLLRLLWSVPLFFVACSSNAQQPNRVQGPNDVVAIVGNTSLTLADVDQRAMQQPANEFGSTKLVLAIYEARRNAIDDLTGEKLIDIEAKARGISTAALIDQEITSKIQTVTDADVSAWYNANQSRVQGASLDQVRAPIRNLLTQQRTAVVYQGFVEQLKLKTPVRIMLEPPRQKIATADSPSEGPADAPIELVEFSDFQCPFCLRAHPVVKQVLTTYGNKIRFVYRNYPLPSHPNAFPAAEAAQCANEQGQFWAYHDRLFADQSKLSDADLKASAAALGLDAAKFNACVDAHKYKARIDTDMQAGNDAGVNGTPAFFINGRLLNGAQPYDEFKKVIDEELAAKRQ
ncbi:MAG TPA: thioredoxin domain-containing protein [Vicinamibacterales bacterium]|nr:thioredoxin domain-containing protein [Vicinamibacterales bacterium]